MYETLQKHTLAIFTFTFLQLVILGIPVSIATIIITLAGLNTPLFPIIYIVIVGCVWIASCAMMWVLQSVWTIPIGKIGPVPLYAKEE